MEEDENRSELAEGSVLRVPDYLWRFVDPSRAWHPGACAAINEPSLRATMFKGTDERNVRPRYRRRYHVVEPDKENGLAKATAFELDPRILKVRPLRLIAQRDMLGLLNSADLTALRRAMRRAIGRLS